MASSAIAADFSQALDVKRYLTTQITLDDVGVVDGFTDGLTFILINLLLTAPGDPTTGQIVR